MEGDCISPDDYEQALSEIAATWEVDEKRRKEELFVWLDDFMASEEFANHFARKTTRVDKCVGPSGDKDKFIAADEHREHVDVKRSERLVLIYEKLQKALIRKQIRNTVRNQKKGIEVIREKILECKRQAKEARLQNLLRKQVEKNRAVIILRDQFNIDCSFIRCTSKLLSKILKCRKQRKQAQKRKEANRLNIARKILYDFKRDKQIRAQIEKRHDYKVLRRKQIAIKPPQRGEVIEADEVFDVDVASTRVSTDEGKGRSLSESKKKDKKKEAPSKKEKTTEGSEKVKKKIEKQKKLKESRAEAFLPIAPIVNKRRKLKGDISELKSILSDLNTLSAALNNKRDSQFDLDLEGDIQKPNDKSIVPNPPKIIFKDFRNGEDYKQTVQLTNGASHVKKLQFEKIIWNANIDDDLLIEVEQFGIQKLYPGCSMSFELLFSPRDLEKTVEAKLVFVTYKPGTWEYKNYVLNVACLPYCSTIIITPTIVSFEEMPIWRAVRLQKERKNFKTIEIKNDGLKDCRIVITKVFNSFKIETAWRNIISILSMSEESSEPITSTDISLEDVKPKDQFPKNLVRECVENVFNTFRFDRSIFNLPGNETKNLKIFFKNMERVGYYVETYMISVYERFPDGNLYCIGSQDVIVNAETTGYFLKLVPEILDFEACALDSVYQKHFDIINPTSHTYNLKIRFPKSIRDYITCNSDIVTVQPKSKHSVHLKLIPRKQIIDENRKYYDAEYDFIEFPIYVAICSKGYEDAPPMTVDTFASITDSLGLNLQPVQKEHIVMCKKQCFLDFGNCTDKEAVYAGVLIKNTSLVSQQYGFLNLPYNVTVSPNYGFGSLKPQEERLLKVYYAADKDKKQLLIPLAVNTVKHLGILKQKLNVKKVLQKLKHMEAIVSSSPTRNDLMDDMMLLVSQLGQPGESYPLKDSTTKNLQDQKMPANQPEMEMVLEVTTYSEEPEKPPTEESFSETASKASEKEEPPPLKPCTNTIWLRVKPIPTMAVLSHQEVNFSDTPYGSYSVVSIELNLVAKNINAEFSIVGDSKEISVEPNFGSIVTNEKVKIYLVARPEIPVDVIEQQALLIKISELERQRINSIRKASEKQNKVKQKKESQQKRTNSQESLIEKRGKSSPQVSSKRSRNKESRSKSRESKKLLDEAEMQIGYFEYYPAEMSVWRFVEPRVIEANFCCKVTLSKEDNDPLVEYHYIKARCRAVKPEFVHDQKLQELDFAGVVIGTSVTKIVTLENIQRHDIRPTVRPVCPLRSFNVPELFDVVVPSEYFLKVPITFSPKQEVKEVEFLEIKANNTIYPFLLRGEGVAPNYQFSPNFTVCRIHAKPNKPEYCTFEFLNNSSCPVIVCLVKVCEIVGDIKAPKLSEKQDKASKKDKSGKSDKTGKSIAKGYTEELTSEEAYSLENFFKKPPPELKPRFSTDQDAYLVGELTKVLLKIRFEVPKDKGNRQTDAKIAPKVCVAKYNIFLGRSVFLKDIIVIGRS